MGILKALSRAGALVWCPISKKIFWLCIGSVKCMPKHLCRHESWRWFDLILVAWIKFPLWKVKTLKTFLSALCWDLRVSSGYALSSAKSYELIEVNNEGWARLWSGAKDIWHPQTLGFADHHHHPSTLCLNIMYWFFPKLCIYFWPPTPPSPFQSMRMSYV